MKRGEIWWVHQPSSPFQAGDDIRKRRQYLIVSADPRGHGKGLEGGFKGVRGIDWARRLSSDRATK